MSERSFRNGGQTADAECFQRSSVVDDPVPALCQCTGRRDWRSECAKRNQESMLSAPCEALSETSSIHRPKATAPGVRLSGGVSYDS